jgi:hypothetical protein
VTMRACGSPNTPCTSSLGRKPGNRYASSKRRRFVEVTRTRLPTPPALARRNHFRFASKFRAPVDVHKALSTVPSSSFWVRIHPHDFTKSHFLNKFGALDESKSGPHENDQYRAASILTWPNLVALPVALAKGGDGGRVRRCDGHRSPNFAFGASIVPPQRGWSRGAGASNSVTGRPAGPGGRADSDAVEAHMDKKISQSR